MHDREAADDLARYAESHSQRKGARICSSPSGAAQAVQFEQFRAGKQISKTLKASIAETVLINCIDSRSVSGIPGWRRTTGVRIRSQQLRSGDPNLAEAPPKLAEPRVDLSSTYRIEIARLGKLTSGKGELSGRDDLFVNAAIRRLLSLWTGTSPLACAYPHAEVMWFRKKKSPCIFCNRRCKNEPRYAA